MKNLSLHWIVYWPKHAQWALIIITCVLIWWGFFVFFTQPIRHQLKQNNSIFSQLIYELRFKQHTLQTSSNENKSNSDVPAILTQLEPQFLSHLLTKLANLSRDNGLELDAIKPLKTHILNNLNVQPIAITVRGHYFQLFHFLQQLATLATFAAVENFKLAAPLKTKENKILTLTITLHLYTRSNSTVMSKKMVSL